ncbi:MAG: hypothetical protein KJZ75_02670 [Hyphomonadaceae bacterium]|nr:hypothetical protein [Hyphomonadaceae bacterium]
MSGADAPLPGEVIPFWYLDKLLARVREAHKEARRRGALRSASRDD